MTINQGPFFAVMEVRQGDSGAGVVHGTLSAPAGVPAGRYALVPAPYMREVPGPKPLTQYSVAVLDKHQGRLVLSNGERLALIRALRNAGGDIAVHLVPKLTAIKGGLAMEPAA